MGPTDIGKYAESVEQFIIELAKTFREKHWVRIFSLIGVVFALLLNPLAVQYGRKLLGFEKLVDYSYRIWLPLTASFFVAAFIVALATRKRAEAGTAPTATSIIKGLLPFLNTKEDAEWFARLQRGNILHECMSFCLGAEASFGILSGESGTGKTSFLLAGLSPGLESSGRAAVYVKFTDSPPLDAIRQALNDDGEKQSLDSAQSLLEILQAAARDDDRPTVLFFDQFEQFFAHHKSKASRKPFIHQMAEWHQQRGSLHVKVLISIRSDFADKLIEFQREMEYTLTLHNMLRLEKFEPQEAAHVINVIAREAEIELDEGFVKELTKHELADREEGTVSPVDIQILAWMIDGQKSSEERAFNRKAFQKLGGVEGLLERFLNRALKARETDARRQAVIEVLLALTDQNVRAGALSLKDLKEKLSGIISDEHLEEAVSWLSKSEIRLITQIQNKNVTYYELSHERIIPPLRRVAAREITAIDEAKQTLDRRVNEWIGNNRSRRYLLTLKEWRLIKHYWTFITLGTQREQKEEFVSLSRRRLLAISLSVALLLLSGIGGYAAYAWYESRPETQIARTQQRLIELLESTRDTKATQYASLLLPVLDEEILPVLDEEREHKLYQKLQPKIKDYDFFTEDISKPLLAEAYFKVGKTDKASDTLNRPIGDVFIVDELSNIKIKRLVYLAEIYVKLSKLDQASKTIASAQQAAARLSPSQQGKMLPSIAKVYIALEKTDEALKVLAQARRIAENNYFHQPAFAESIAEIYIKLGMDDEAKRLFPSTKGDMIFSADGRVIMFWRPASLTGAYIRAGKIDEAEKLLQQASKESPPSFSVYDQLSLDDRLSLVAAYIKAGKIDEATKQLADISDDRISMQSDILPSLTETYIKLGLASKAAAILSQAQQSVRFVNRDNKLSQVAESYIKLGMINEALAILPEAQLEANFLPLNKKLLALVKIAALYAKLQRWRKALATAQAIGNEVYAIEALSKILIIWKDTQNGTHHMEALEELFQKIDDLSE